MSFRDEFGLDVDEIFTLRSRALEFLGTQKSILARRFLESSSPETSTRIHDTLIADRLKSFSEAGQNTLVLWSRDRPDEIKSLDGLARILLADPVNFKNLTVWCFFFALLESSANFQIDHCPSPSAEGHLTGMLLGEISGQCEVWRKVAAKPLDRMQTTLSLDRIDLSIRGGEQATGGDFGLILQIDERGTQPASLPEAYGVRIVPLIFQAKRYVRPTADVSQQHDTRGYQYHLLSQNQCASAYIFYENGIGRVRRPVPALIKSVANVSSPDRTPVFNDSLDLPCYLFKALHDSAFAPGASSPGEALRMIYANADAGQLANLAVISNSSVAGAEYSAALTELDSEIRRLDDQGTTEDPLTN